MTQENLWLGGHYGEEKFIQLFRVYMQLDAGRGPRLPRCARVVCDCEDLGVLVGLLDCVHSPHTKWGLKVTNISPMSVCFTFFPLGIAPFLYVPFLYVP